MKIRLSLAALLIALPLGAAAFIPPPQCAVEPASGALFPFGDPRGTDMVWPARYPGGMVMTDWRDETMGLYGYLQHCPTETTLQFSVPARHADQVRGRLEAMLTSDISYSFDDVRRQVRLLGGRARMVASPGRCACDAAAGF